VPVANHRGLPAAIRDISLGGLSMELAEEVAVDSVHDFGFTLGNGTEIVLRARVAHTRREARLQGRPVFVTGVQFLADVSGQASGRPLQLAS
jgi:hypothetical protein